MGINKGYWAWGLFPFRETKLLNEIKSKVQSKLKRPVLCKDDPTRFDEVSLLSPIHRS